MRVPIENNGKMPIYVAGTMIPPGETGHFEEDMLPPEYRQSAAVEMEHAPEDPLFVVLSLKVSDVVKGLPSLSDEELDRLEILESADKPRKGVIAAITEERLRRAEAKVAGAVQGEPDAGGEAGEEQGGEDSAAKQPADNEGGEG